MVAAIRVLTELPAPRLLVLGDMGEVGEQGLDFHLEVLRHAMASGIESVHCAGDWMAQAVQVMHAAGEAAPRHWTDVTHLTTHVCHTVRAAEALPVRSVLVKGSRFMRMERVVQGLQALDLSAGNTQTIKDTHAA